jgi:hypothetical protein
MPDTSGGGEHVSGTPEPHREEQRVYYDSLRALRKLRKTRGGRKMSEREIRHYAYTASKRAASAAKGVHETHH